MSFSTSGSSSRNNRRRVRGFEQLFDSRSAVVVELRCGSAATRPRRILNAFEVTPTAPPQTLPVVHGRRHAVEGPCSALSAARGADHPARAAHRAASCRLRLGDRRSRRVRAPSACSCTARCCAGAISTSARTCAQSRRGARVAGAGDHRHARRRRTVPTSWVGGTRRRRQGRRSATRPLQACARSRVLLSGLRPPRETSPTNVRQLSRTNAVAQNLFIVSTVSTACRGWFELHLSAGHYGIVNRHLNASRSRRRPTPSRFPWRPTKKGM